MQPQSKHFSRSRDSSLTCEKTFTKHHASSMALGGSESTHFQQFLRSQCQDLVCSVEELKHNTEMDNCTIDYLNEQLQEREAEIKRLAQKLVQSDMKIERLAKKSKEHKEELVRLRDYIKTVEKERETTHQGTLKQAEEVAYVADKLDRMTKEADKLRDQNRLLKDEAVRKQDKIIEIQRVNGQLMKQLEAIRIEHTKMATQNDEYEKQLELLSRKLAHTQREKVELLGKFREMECEYAGLAKYRSEKAAIQSEAKEKDKQLEILTKQVNELEHKNNEVEYKNDRLTQELKQSEDEWRIEKNVLQTQLAHARGRQDQLREQIRDVSISPLRPQNHTHVREPSYKNPNVSASIRVIQSLPSEESIDEGQERRIGGITKKPNRAELEYLINQYEQINRRRQERERSAAPSIF